MMDGTFFVWLNEAIRNREEISDETVFLFIDRLPSVFAEEKEELKLAESILSYLQEIWNYQDFHKINKKQAYLYGAMFGAINVLFAEEMKKRKETEFKIMFDKYKDSGLIPFLKTIHDNPGIRKKEICDTCNGKKWMILALNEKFILRNMDMYFISGKGEQFLILWGKIVR